MDVPFTHRLSDVRWWLWAVADDEGPVGTEPHDGGHGRRGGRGDRRTGRRYVVHPYRFAQWWRRRTRGVRRAVSTPIASNGPPWCDGCPCVVKEGRPTLPSCSRASKAGLADQVTSLTEGRQPGARTKDRLPRLSLMSCNASNRFGPDAPPISALIIAMFPCGVQVATTRASTRTRSEALPALCVELDRRLER